MAFGEQALPAPAAAALQPAVLGRDKKKKKKKQRKNKKEKSVVELGRSETFAALWLFGSKNSSWKGRELGESEAGEVTLPLRASVSPSVKIN